MSEENRKGLEEARSESVGRDSDSWGLRSVLSQRELDVLMRGYGISEEAGARLARGSKMAKYLAKGYVVVFDSQLKFGLRFPIF